MRETVEGDLLPACAGLAVVAVRVDRNAAARGKFAPDLNVFRVHKADKVFHDDVHTVLVEIAVIAEAEQIQLERLALYHALTGHIGDINGRKVRLSGHRAQARKLRTVKLYEVIVLRMLVRKALEHFRCIIRRILVFLIPQKGDAVQFFFISSGHRLHFSFKFNQSALIFCG